MKLLKHILILCTCLSLTSCFEDNDDNLISSIDINDFVWKGMNAFYLYKDEIPDLANDRFASDEGYSSYLNSFSAPEALFESLIFQRETTDRFSVIVRDYIALEQQFQGTSVSNGMEFGLFRFNASDSQIYGYVRYVLPNTSAEANNLKRGDIFYAVNGTALTIDNFRNLLLASNSYSINLGNYNDNGTPIIADDSITPTETTIALTKAAYTENPVYLHTVLDVGNETVGYLMYNGFTGTDAFDSQLNAVFSEFQSAGISDLVLDLRYNGGGSVNTAIWLSSMITGQFTGDLLVREEWNSDIQAEILANNPESLLNPFVDQMIKTNGNGEVVFQENINHLNLNKVYVLTTENTASASELVINGLNPYITVIQIGTKTRGKYQASTTLYDSPNFRRTEANPNHTYAMQPLILKSINSVGFTDFDNGLLPQIGLEENFGNLGVLGNENEPLLAAALADIQGLGRFNQTINDVSPTLEVQFEADPFENEMYVAPNDFLNGLK
ncbi:carboxyl-terminal protease [Subsaximicrobium wynnwilliamsii]|uniref:Carboxyl-terminal protease n=1 Tax=Subsaximicrobium wynnwilliamsii TaxID=291179 RepID=A0A5C6ZNS1_9FLAO|nr:S41 family peptidase [Subsaximicrobium wynnwilliamsii]TXD84700.1 carboxyl-terminal protease [Subsaximicrobium wynnwilliamsii]TXD90370.1 carboxyl-terminal protease [Subsaximicrobium wynnwilliamsii]TXE04846.1 carboxyl-terminal protease [Subsaximicrobium wynnwilliamsii]